MIEEDFSFCGESNVYLTETKLEAARRQLNAAIRMWFNDDDAVAIQTLAHASHEIIDRLCHHAGHNPPLFGSELIAKERRMELGWWLRRAPNFFKHADRERDPDDAIEFPTNSGPLFLMGSVLGLQRLGYEPTAIEYALVLRSMML